MEMNMILKWSTFLIILILFFPFVHLMPVEEKNDAQSGLLSFFTKQFERVLGVSLEGQGVFNLQKPKGFETIEEVIGQTIKPIFDRLLDLFTLPFEHLEIQEQQIHDDSESNQRECKAPGRCFTKKQGDNLCTICEDDMVAATDLINYFEESRNITELLYMAEKCKNYLNEYLFNYALTYILLTKFPDFDYPSFFEVFPGLFITKQKLKAIKKEVAKKHRLKRNDETAVQVIPVFYTVYEDKELSLNYFREDYGYNSHHWNWHIVHRVYSRIDRRGELFWYMHHQMLARYDLERLSLGLDRVKSSGPLNQTIDVGYFPNLDSTSSGTEWASRQDNTMPQNIRRNERVILNISEISEWHTRLSQAALDGFMKDEDGQEVLLSDDVNITSGVRRGIDIFTAAAENDRQITPNREFYGNLHNAGHNIIAQMHDPDNRHELGANGVMASAAVSARDPAFYMWHKYFEEVIQEYKRTQKPYTHQRLELAHIYLYEVQVSVDVNLARHKRESSPDNVPQGTTSTQNVSDEASPQNVSEETTPPQNVSTDTPPPQNVSTDTPPPQNVSTNTPPPHNVSTDTPPPQNVSTDTPPPQNVSTDTPPPQSVSTETPTPQNVSQETPTPHNVSQETPTPQNVSQENLYTPDVNGSLDSEHHNIYSNPETIDAEVLGGSKNIVIQPELLTGCNTYGINISRGIDFGNYRKNVILELTHLDHVPFHYYISVWNSWLVNKNVMVRIFLAPKFSAYGQAMSLEEQRHLYVILDKFGYVLSPGRNFIDRLSTESTVTSNCRNSTTDFTRQRYTPGLGVFGGGHCGCGWPHHLLLPRGSPRGMMFQLFVLLTDWDIDHIPSEGVVSSLCSLTGDKYPDWQPMGYPFDRPFNQSINNAGQLAENLINAHVSDVPIRFTGRHVISKELTC